MNRTVVVEPTGEHATIDTALARDAIAGLLDTDPDVRRQVAELVQLEPERLAPPVLYALSEVLLDRGRPADAAFWFHAGQVRARFDARRCTDPTAAAAVEALDERFGGPVNRFAFTDPERLRRTVVRAVAWDRRTPHHYDHRWIALHGMSAYLGSAGPLSVPEEEWDALAARTRADYLAGLRIALRSVPHPR
ncbi:hypothetical protein LWC35_07030 [Pseudonocardia kujensis]|uniref:hypothetical protein n=1 Tax=Pseudonocardia kujensis TaxID=1128675 RepID=UPI001E38925E|nr:hypothetical protein [Pseudonocardia kujensis]MCE0762662.1 hypothetical protein [Pseudonocardia kujensis]